MKTRSGVCSRERTHPARGKGSGKPGVSHHQLFAARGDLSGACGEAIVEEGSTRGKHGFPRGSEAKPSEERGVFA
jgi:hypothetical protein